MDSNLLIKSYLAELLERVLRFEMHLTAIEASFYNKKMYSNNTSAPRDWPLFIRSFRTCIDTILEVIHKIGKRQESTINDSELELIMQLIRLGFTNINQLHTNGLVHLPRPSEPIELRRFLRMISRHVLAREKADLSVYTTEDTAESSYAEDPLSKIKLQDINEFLRLGVSILGGESKVHIAPPSTNGIHVTIGRIDAHNPLRWPTLIHEAAHKLFSRDFTGGLSLQDQFLGWLNPGITVHLSTIKIDLNSWLTETWCDLFAALLLGPAFFFAQFAAFISTPCCDSALDKGYPPHGFRLRIIRDCLRHRHPIINQTPEIYNHISDCIELAEYWEIRHRVDIGSNHLLKILYDSFRGFFQETIFPAQSTDEHHFTSKFEKVSRYAYELKFNHIQVIQLKFSEGLPAPSKPHRSGIMFAEEPTSIQEVLLAAWLDRLGRLRTEVLNSIISNAFKISSDFDRSVFYSSISRFDDAVLRSLQLAEWLHIIAPISPKDISSILSPSTGGLTPANSNSHASSMLNDSEIASLIHSGDLKVVPLVDLDQQLGSSSLDIRLGTSFEVFLSAYRRTPDSEDNETTPYDSGPIDLDFLEHVVILPGQIMLAHSFEYMKLPSNIAGELEGRSSYARLGLEVHLTAGMIDPGFEGVITFELVNNGPNPIPLYPGMRVAQLRFFIVKPPVRPYSTRHTAKYKGLLQHRTSLYMNDLDYKRIQDAIKELYHSLSLRKLEPSNDDQGAR